jgi:hypothetical protein
MARNRPTGPIGSYPEVAAEEQPPVPTVDPPTTASAEGSAGGVVPGPAELPAPARLIFRGNTKPLVEVIALDFPFEWEGRLVDSVTVRRLTVAEVAEAVDQDEFEQHGIWAVFAAQCGLPVAVLRGMIEDDGARVMDANHRFLPRAFAAIVAHAENAATASVRTPASGAATSPG